MLRPLACALALACLLPAVAVAKGPNDRTIINSTGFLSAHPDLNWRLRGLDAYRAGKFEEALKLFRKAARYADKPAQGMVAEMLWQGQGTAQDKALAYAWMDLAAERNYPTMVLNRERYWKQLDAAQRDEALARGKDVFAEYADAVAKPRLEAQLRQGRVSSGSHIAGGGAGRAVTIAIAGPGGMRTIDASEYYAPQYWEPEQYWTWQDDDWRALPKGVVNIGPLESPAPPAQATDTDADPAQ
jgi:hypothetical protein